ncbi:MAG: DUF1501 domain-containing protein [Planctomycetota bacterium]|nr:DUF1501 domain-containing protein [Planctomycetota bacterium]
MLSIFDANDRCNRRALLSAGGLGFGGLSLANLLAAKSLAGSGDKPISTGKSVVFLLQHGGPTQFETFDPKLDVPDGIRTVGGVTRTSVPGLTLGSTLQRIAKLAHRLAIVRSYTTGSASHSIRPLISEASRKANIGSLYSRLVGANNAASGMPTNVTLFPNSVEPTALGPDLRFGKFSQTGEFGSAFAPFAPGGGSELQANMKLALPADRFDDRCTLLTALDRLRERVDQSGMMEGLDKYRQQAFEMVVRGVSDAFDLSKEDSATLARYDTRQFVNETSYADKSNGKSSRRWYQNNALTLGKQLLLARRLCEAGCGFVTVATRFVWDMHGDANNLGVSRGMQAVGQPFDHAVSAFIEDCEARGLSDKILLVCAGEMGRTPRINKNAGRDHWARLAPLMLYGGGITDGQVIGQSTRDGGEPFADAVDSENLIATILRTLLDIAELRLKTGLPPDLVRFVTTGDPIPRLFS